MTTSPSGPSTPSSRRSLRRRSKRLTSLRARLTVLAVGAVALAVAIPGIAAASSPAPRPKTNAVTIWGDAPTATPVVDAERASVELGTAFTSSVDGSVTGVRFWKTKENKGTHVGSLWGPDGTRLASVTFTNETDSKWQQASFRSPVPIKAGKRYVISYLSPHGRYVSTTNFTGQSRSSVLSVPRGRSGVYSYGSTSTFPTKSWHASQYWVDAVFVPGHKAPQATTRFATPSSTKAPTPSSTPRQPTKPSVKPKATLPKKPSPTPTRSSAPKPSPTPSQTATQPATPPASSTTTTSPSVPKGTQGSIGAGWAPSSASVGLAPQGLKCSSLPEYKQSGHVVPAGTTISGKRITTWLDLSKGGITISRSCIQPLPGEVGRGSYVLSTWGGSMSAGPVTIEDSEFDGSLLSTQDAAWISGFVGVASFYRNYIHDFGSGIPIYSTYEKSGSNVVVQNNVVEHLVAWGDPGNGGNHQSAFTIRDFDTSVNANRQLLVRDNNFACDASNCTGAFFIQPNSGDVSNVTVTGNLLRGNGYQLYLDYQPNTFAGMTYSNLRATNNRMTNTEYGASYVRPGGPGWAQWDQNYVYKASAVDGKGTLLARP